MQIYSLLTEFQVKAWITGHNRPVKCLSSLVRQSNLTQPTNPCKMIKKMQNAFLLQNIVIILKLCSLEYIWSNEKLVIYIWLLWFMSKKCHMYGQVGWDSIEV